jgi:hypothetical protein
MKILRAVVFRDSSSRWAVRKLKMLHVSSQTASGANHFALFHFSLPSTKFFKRLR